MSDGAINWGGVSAHAASRFCERILGCNPRAIEWRERWGELRRQILEVIFMDITQEVTRHPRKRKELSLKTGYLDTDVAIYVVKYGRVITVLPRPLSSNANRVTSSTEVSSAG